MGISEIAEGTLELEVPVNATATVILPTTDTSSITESNHRVASADRVLSQGVTNDGASYLVGSGNYAFAASIKHQ